MENATYDYLLVALSYIVACLGSYTALSLAIRIPTAKGGKEEFNWLSKGSIAIGGGIWSMHFIGMLAYRMPMAVNYDIPLTILSLLIAILVCGIGLYVAGRGNSALFKLFIGGVITGLGVATMHYMGMAAMQMPATMSYDLPLFYLSIAIAIVAATAALWLAFNMRGILQHSISALVMGVAVCGMHYTGMAAMDYTMTTAHTLHTTSHSANPWPNAMIIFCIAAAIFFLLSYLSKNDSTNLELEFEEA